MNRGSPTKTDEIDVVKSGFNEAPIHESGKCPGAGARGRCRTGFNEAPIHESGKWRGCGSMPRYAQCFNEAPIHESGK